MFYRTRLCNALGIKLPIIQAGMAGGITTPDLVSEVSNAGGLGTLGAAYMKPGDIRDEIRKIREKTTNPYAVNLFSIKTQDSFERLEEVQAVLNPIRSRLGIPEGKLTYKNFDEFDEQLQVLLDEKVPIISTAFGCLPEQVMSEVKQNGVKVITMVTTVEEAVEAERVGADVIVAQGSEAGGHRGTFNVEKYPEGANIGTFALVPQIVEAVNVPVVAAGGIMNGRGLVAALALGASGIQMGTRFLTAYETSAHEAYKKVLLESNEVSTQLTKSFSGRPARGIRNAFIEEFDDSRISPLPFPSQNTMTNDIRAAAKEQSNSNYMSLWAGQGVGLLTAEQSAKSIMNEIIEEAVSVIQNDFLSSVNMYET